MSLLQIAKAIIPERMRGRLRRFLSWPRKLVLTTAYHAGLMRVAPPKFSGLHLGCGSARIEGFLNVDAWMQTNCDVMGQLEDIKLRDESVSFIYCSHALEHVSHKEYDAVLAEWFRVLKPGGRLYLCVPDVEVLFTIYLEHLPFYSEPEHRALVDDTVSVIYGEQSYRNNFHKNGFSLATLSHALISAGFTSIDPFDHDDAHRPFILPLDSSRAKRDGKPISLNLIATKPRIQSTTTGAVKTQSER